MRLPDRKQVEQSEQLRREVMKRKLWQLIAIAAACSLLFHVGAMIYLGLIQRAGPPGQVVEMVVEFPTSRVVEELTSMSNTELSEPDQQSNSELDQLLEPETPSPQESSAAQLSESDVGATPVMGGAGSRGVSGQSALGGAGGAASFFGISSKGERFAYIVDKSGSMSRQKMALATSELMRSVRSLPDYASFFVVFFSSSMDLPSWQKNWVRARQKEFTALSRWVSGIDTGGSTEPLGSFRRVLGLNPKPDVIYFLTDGEVYGVTAEEIANLNRRGQPTVINTIAYATQQSQQLLEQIARESGGVYRFVPVRTAP